MAGRIGEPASLLHASIVWLDLHPPKAEIRAATLTLLPLAESLGARQWTLLRFLWSVQTQLELGDRSGGLHARSAFTSSRLRGSACRSMNTA